MLMTSPGLDEGNSVRSRGWLRRSRAGVLVDAFAYAFGGGNDEDGYFLSEGIGGSRYRDLNVSGDRCPVLSAEEPLRTSRLVLSDLTARTIKLGLSLLGISVLERI